MTESPKIVTTSKEPLYENETYRVELHNDGCVVEGTVYNDYYSVVRKENGVVEIKTPVLPEACRLAVHLDLAWQHRSFEWPYTQQARMEEGHVPGEVLDS